MMKKNYFLIGLMLMINTAFAQNLSGYQREANYTFATDGSDSESNYGNATIFNATYSQGGIYSNGLYSGSNSNGSVIETPSIAGLNVSNFAVKLDFKTDSTNNYIMICGNLWRWLRVYTLADSTLELQSEVVGGSHLSNTNFKITPGTWYTLGMIYDSTSKNLEVYVDNTLRVTTTLSANFEINGDFSFTNQETGFGETYKGYWKNLQFFKPITTSVNEESQTKQQVYFNPNTKKIIVNTTFSESKYAIYDATGKELKSGIFHSNQSEINVGNFITGIYFVSINSKNNYQTHKLIVR